MDDLAVNGVDDILQVCICSTTVEIAERLLEAIFDNGVEVECNESDLFVSLEKRLAIPGTGLHLIDDVPEPVRLLSD